MMKILFLIHDLSHGGAEKVLVNLVNNMDKTKFDVTVMTLFDVGINKQFLNSNVHYKTCFHKVFKGNSYILKLFSPNFLYRRFIKEYYDIVVSYLEGPTARIVSGCSDSRTKLVSWIHIEQHTKKIACRSFRSYKEARKCYSRFDKTVCVSEYVKNDFQNIFSLNKTPIVLYNTNETEQIRKLSKEQVGGFSDEELKLIGVGKILPKKGFDRLARIHKRLRDEGCPVHSYILGVGGQKKEIEEYLQKNGLEDTFTFLGYQTNPYKYVAGCDLFVCSSYAEGFSTAATEALIVGTPVVTTRVSGMEEMLGNNEYGIITDNDEASLYEGIKKLADDRKLLEHYRCQAEIRGRDFSTEKTVKAVENMLISL